MGTLWTDESREGEGLHDGPLWRAPQACTSPDQPGIPASSLTGPWPSVCTWPHKCLSLRGSWASVYPRALWVPPLPASSQRQLPECCAEAEPSTPC